MAAGKYNTDQNYDDDIDFIKDSNPVQGDPAGTDPDNTPLTGPINVVVQKIIGSLAYLKNAVDNFDIPRMTQTVFGIGRTATQQEAEDGTAHGAGGPLLTPLRGRQTTENYIRSSDAQANTSRRGTSRRATQAEAEAGNNNERHLTPSTGMAQLRHSNAKSNESRLGTVERANQNERRSRTDDERYMTSKGVDDMLLNGVSPATVANDTNSISFTVDHNIIIGRLLILRIRNSGETAWNDESVWTIGGGAWRIINMSLESAAAGGRGTMVDTIFSHTQGSTTYFTEPLNRNIIYNANNTTFKLVNQADVEADEVLQIFAILN